MNHKSSDMGTHRFTFQARRSKPTHVIISSRSSEWDYAATTSFKDFLGKEPIVARLQEFGDSEQRQLFDEHTPGEDFTAFQTEVARFDLKALLPNPQFLKLFADAYVQSGRSFTDKRSIFVQAVERLAKEANSTIKATTNSLSNRKKVELASEVFAKILLSGAEGVTTSEAEEQRLYPLLASLAEDATSINTILATRLFRPGTTEDAHRPVHKIVAEYAASDYLTKRIIDPADVLSLAKCLPVIAPNSTVRDELRGMLGWMASPGNRQIQETAIELDPYAVLANGDPSQLVSTSKRLLVRKLKDIEDKDPYFRRGDFWRRFSVAGFFTQDVVDEIRPLITINADGQLRDLLLELLEGSPATALLTKELNDLILSTQVGEHARVMAAQHMTSFAGYNHRANLAQLIFQADPTSLKVAAKTISTLGTAQFSLSYLAGFFRVCANLYPKVRRARERTYDARHYLRSFIETLSLQETADLLDTLSNGLVCTCGQKVHDCHCRNGMSKIIGLLLDHYCEIASSPHDPKRFWQWLRNLNFHSSITPDRSRSVVVLRADDDLRQGIMLAALGHETDAERIRNIRLEQFEWDAHSGLHFQPTDWSFLANFAFATDNPSLWSCFIATHNHHLKAEDRGPDELRKRMRAQASEKPLFLKEWAQRNRQYTMMMREHREKRHWFQRRKLLSGCRPCLRLNQKCFR